MFAEMDSFAKAVLSYCSKNLVARDSGNDTAAAAAMEDDGDGDRGPSSGGSGAARPAPRPRPDEEELCAVVAEQWRLTAATLTRSRCVKGNGDPEARERREVRAERGEGTRFILMWRRACVGSRPMDSAKRRWRFCGRANPQKAPKNSKTCFRGNRFSLTITDQQSAETLTREGQG